MNNKGILAIVFSLVAIGTGVLFLSPKKDSVLSAQSTNNSAPADLSDTSASTFTLAEIAKHSNKKSCWLSIEGGVYDVTKFIPQHPGGSRILMGCGKDASSLFNGASGHIHSQVARALLKKYKIGTLSK